MTNSISIIDDYSIYSQVSAIVNKAAVSRNNARKEKRSAYFKKHEKSKKYGILSRMHDTHLIKGRIS